MINYSRLGYEIKMDFKDKRGRSVQCKMSCIPVRLCEFPSKELVLTVVYGFGEEPMLLLSNLKMQGLNWRT